MHETAAAAAVAAAGNHYRFIDQNALESALCGCYMHTYSYTHIYISHGVMRSYSQNAIWRGAMKFFR